MQNFSKRVLLFAFNNCGLKGCGKLGGRNKNNCFKFCKCFLSEVTTSGPVKQNMCHVRRSKLIQSFMNLQTFSFFYFLFHQTY